MILISTFQANWLILDMPRMGPMYYIGSLHTDNDTRYVLARIVGSRQCKFTPIDEVKDIERFYTYRAAVEALKVLMRTPLKELPDGKYLVGIIAAADGKPYASVPLTINNGVSPCKT